MKKLFSKIISVLVLFGMLMLGGCSSFKDYTVNGVPVDAMYADSGQSVTDADVDNGTFCEENPKFCSFLFLAAGGIAYALMYNFDDRAQPTPAPAPLPPAL